MIVSLLWVGFLFVAGLLLSAFFSGTETGYFRATRVRLAMDAVDGRLVSRSLMWLANNPVMFVATVLVGNNLANNLVSYSIILGVAVAGYENNVAIELLAPIALTPIIFVYGELLPKELFFNAPNRLLRIVAPLFLFFSVVFLPITSVLWLLGRLLTMLIGQSPEKLHSSLARSELQRLFDEGKDEGVLNPAQRELAATMFDFANRPLEQFWDSPGRVPTVVSGAQKQDALRLMRRAQVPEIVVTDPKSREVLGYVHILDLHASDNPRIESWRKLMDVAATDSPLSVLMRLQDEKQTLARAVDANGKTVGLISLQALTDVVWSSH